MKQPFIDSGMRVLLAREMLGWEPHPTQKLWLEDEHTVKVAACGRRWGKTEAQSIDAAMFALTHIRSTQMIVSPTYDQSKLIFDAVERTLLKGGLAADVKVVRTPYPRIELCGSVIMARTADEDGRNLRGHSADRVIVDEAAYVKDAVIDEVISPMLADRNGQLILISTPFGRNHFYEAFVQGQSGGGDSRIASFRFPSWENPHISRDYVEYQRQALTARQFSVEYEAEFIDDQNAVFSWSDIEAAVSCRPVEAEPGAQRVAGIDWARYADYTAVVVLDVSQSPHAVVAIDRFNQLSWQVQVERAADFLQKHGARTVLVDQTSIGDPLIEQLRRVAWEERGMDLDVQGLVFTNASKREVVDNLSLKLARRDLTIPNDEPLLRELQYFEYELTDGGNVRLNAKSGFTDDMVVALALAAWAARAPAGAGDRFLSSGRRRAVEDW